MKTIFAFLFLFLSIPCAAQNVPECFAFPCVEENYAVTQNSPATKIAKTPRVADWRFWLVELCAAGAFIADVESTYASAQRCYACKEGNGFFKGQRPSRKKMYLTYGGFHALAGAGTYALKMFWQDEGYSPNVPVWGVIQIPATILHAFAAKSNSQIQSDRSRNFVCPSGMHYNERGGCTL